MASRKEGRYASGRLPNGPYLMEIIKCVDASRDSYQEGVSAWRLTWQLIGTDLKLEWFVSGSEKTEWAWREWSPSFEAIPMHVGNIYLVFIEQTVTTRPRNQIKSVMAEVLPDS